jgi:hypothetical protein
MVMSDSLNNGCRALVPAEVLLQIHHLADQLPIVSTILTNGVVHQKLLIYAKIQEQTNPFSSS